MLVSEMLKTVVTNANYRLLPNLITFREEILAVQLTFASLTFNKTIQPVNADAGTQNKGHLKKLELLVLHLPVLKHGRHLQKCEL